MMKCKIAICFLASLSTAAFSAHSPKTGKASREAIKHAERIALSKSVLKIVSCACIAGFATQEAENNILQAFGAPKNDTLKAYIKKMTLAFIGLSMLWYKDITLNTPTLLEQAKEKVTAALPAVPAALPIPTPVVPTPVLPEVVPAVTA